MKTPDGPSHRLPDRRRFLSLGLGAFVVAAVPLARARRRALVRRTVPIMGTIADLAVVHRDPRFAHGALDAAIAQLRLVEATMTRFRDDSEVGRANRAAALRPVAISAQTTVVAIAALRWAEATDGAFDPCLGRATALWDVTHRTAPPDAGDVRHWADRRLYRELELGRRGAQDVVVFHDADLALDLGGIAKGYGVDRAVAALRDWGIADGLVNVGGDLYALGASEDGDGWEVGVRSAVDPTALTTRFRISDRAVATSGDYVQYFDHAGRRYHHLLDPATGEPRRTVSHSLTVAAADCMTADAAATALFGMTRREAVERLRAVAPAAEVVPA
jgi:thiamine biosynthesis lipoprotein